MLSTTERTVVRRGKHKARTDHSDLYDLLDEGLICHMGVVVDGTPRVIPTSYARLGETLYLHGSTGARSLRETDEVCVTVTLLDGLVLARSAMHHSVNHRSAMIFGSPRVVSDPGERDRALEAVIEQAVPGRADMIREPNAKELAATRVLALPLSEASVKVRTGPPNDDEEDHDLPVWGGVVPIRQVYGKPEPAPNLRPGVSVPEHVTALVREG